MRGVFKKESFLAVFSFFLFCSLLLLWAPPGQSAEIRYPERPVTMLLGTAPGGSADITARLIADKVQEFLGQQIISVHKPGGGQSLAPSLAAKAKADGYTILFGSTSPMVVAPIVRKLDYSLDDFLPMGMYGKMPFLFAVKPDARWKNLKEFIAEEKKSPGKLKVGSNGKLTAADLMIELLNKQAGVNLTNVPFKSSGEALTAVLGEKIDAALIAGSGGLLQAGQIRLIGIFEATRLKDLPDVPTSVESGYPIVLTGRNSLWMPKGVPKEIVAKFVQAQDRAFKKYAKEIEDGLKKFEMYAEFLGPEVTRAEFKKEYDLLYKIASEMGVVGKAKE
jgi:tripartite-type tricarboxylate transporter receptor subunit TctC